MSRPFDEYPKDLPGLGASAASRRAGATAALAPPTRTKRAKVVAKRVLENLNMVEEIKTNRRRALKKKKEEEHPKKVKEKKEKKEYSKKVKK